MEGKLNAYRVYYTFESGGSVWVLAPSHRAAEQLVENRAINAGDLPEASLMDGATFEAEGEVELATPEDVERFIDGADRPVLRPDEDDDPEWATERAPEDFDHA